MARDRAREAEDLRHGVTEIERAEPVEGEDIELVAEEERLANADALHAAATTAHEALAGDPASGSYDAADVTSLLAAARSALERAAQHDAQLGALAARVGRGGVPARGRRCRAGVLCASRSRPIPVRLAVVQERRADLTRLVRAYGAGTPGGPPAGDLAAVLAWAKSAAARLAELDGDEDKIGALAAQEAELAAAVADLAGQLTAARTADGRPVRRRR